MTNDKQRERLTTDKTKIFVRENITLMSVTKDELRRHYNEIFDRLQEYEVAEETGQIIVPPVKYGDKLYIITECSKAIVETIVLGVWVYEESFTVLTIHGNILNDSFGKTVFFAKEEAVNALGGVQG